MATDKLKRHKSPATDQIPAELITAGASTIRSELNKLINSMLNCLRSGRIRSLYLFIRRVLKQLVLILGAYQFF